MSDARAPGVPQCMQHRWLDVASYFNTEKEPRTTESHGGDATLPAENMTERVIGLAIDVHRPTVSDLLKSV